jgi:hypothetical protein
MRGILLLATVVLGGDVDEEGMGLVGTLVVVDGIGVDEEDERFGRLRTTADVVDSA